MLIYLKGFASSSRIPLFLYKSGSNPRYCGIPPAGRLFYLDLFSTVDIYPLCLSSHPCHTHTHTPQSPSFLNFNYFLLEDSLSGLYNQNDFIKLCCKNHAFIPKSWQPTVCLFRKTLVYFGLHPNIFQKEGPFFVAGTPHAGCNGNLGSLPLVIAPPFYFGEPRERGDLSPRAWVEPPYRLTLST